MALAESTSCTERLSAKLRASRIARSDSPEVRALKERIAIRKLQANCLNTNKDSSCIESDARLHITNIWTYVPPMEQKLCQCIPPRLLEKGGILKRKKASPRSTSGARANNSFTKEDSPTPPIIPPSTRKRSHKDYIDWGDVTERVGRDSKRVATYNYQPSTILHVVESPKLAHNTLHTPYTPNPTTICRLSSTSATGTAIEKLTTKMEALSLRHKPHKGITS